MCDVRCDDARYTNLPASSIQAPYHDTYIHIYIYIYIYIFAFSCPFQKNKKKKKEKKGGKKIYASEWQALSRFLFQLAHDDDDDDECVEGGGRGDRAGQFTGIEAELRFRGIHLPRLCSPQKLSLSICPVSPLCIKYEVRGFTVNCIGV